MQEKVIQLLGDGEDHFRIHAAMLFPCKPNSHRYLTEDVAVTATELAALESEVAASTRQGIMAGFVLLARAVMAHKGMREPSNRKVAEANSDFYDRRNWGDDEPMRVSQRKIEQDFAAMRDVAHLWAAHDWFLADYGKQEIKQRMKTKVGLGRFLRCAAYLQEFGLRETTPRRNVRLKETLLDGRTIWRIPDHVRPIAPSALPDFEEVTQKVLTEYRAPIRAAQES